MLAGEQGGRHQHHHLAPGLYRKKGGTHGDLGLAEADVAADDTVHRARCGHVLDHRLDGDPLIRRLLEREVGDEASVLFIRGGTGEAFPGLAAGIDVEQLGGGIADLLGGLALGLFPLFRAQSMQRCQFIVGTGVAGNKVQAVHRHVELGAVGVLEADEFGRLAAGFQRFQPAVAADAVGLVDHRGADLEFGKMAYGEFVVVGGLGLAAGLAHDLAEQFRLGDHTDRGGAERQAAGELPLGDGQARAAGEEVGKSVRGVQCTGSGGQGLLQRFPTPPGLGHEQHPPLCVLVQKASERRQRILCPGIDRHLGGVAGIRGMGVGMLAVCRQLDPGVGLDQPEQFRFRDEGTVWRQQGAGRIDAEIFVAAGDRLPVVLGGFAAAGHQGDAGIRGQMVEQ